MVREWLEPERRAHRALAALHGRRVDLVVAVSDGVRRQWHQVTRAATPVVVIPNWLESPMDASSAHFTPLESREGILCIGRFNAWKGQEALASEYEAAFGGGGDRPSLTFVGEQRGTPFEARARVLRERGSNGMWNVQPFAADPSPYGGAAALLVVPSLHPEPFGMVILEALASGCRVLAYEGGGPDDLARVVSPLRPDRSPPPWRLADALREWWADGGPAQSASGYAQTRRLLASAPPLPP